MSIDELEDLIEDYAPRDRVGYDYQKNYDIIYVSWWLPSKYTEDDIEDLVVDIEDEVGTRIGYRTTEARSGDVVLTMDVSLPQ